MSIELNKEQEQVINELEKNILLIASAGTGKTDTLARRVSNIISMSKAKAEEILCITFTNKACKEMKERIESLVGSDGRYVVVKTFHSFCLQIIREQAKKNTDIFTDFTVSDEDDCKEVIKSINHNNYPIKSLQRFINTVKEYRVKYSFYSDNGLKDYENVIENLYKYNNDLINEICIQNYKYLDKKLKEQLNKEGASLVKAYNSMMANNHALDFNDLIMHAKDIFENEEVVISFKERYKYINIDEMQDTSLSEYNIIEKIFGNNNILLCGDKFQTIYSWRGSQPTDIMTSFEKYNPEKMVFTKNYRATKNLTQAALGYLENSFNEDVKETYKDGIEAFSKVNGETIKLKQANTIVDEAWWIYRVINELKESGKDITRTCILTRDNNYNIELSKEFTKINENPDFKFVLVDEFKFFRRQEIKDITAFLKLIVNNNDAISLARLLKRLNTGIGDRTLDKINSDEYKRVGIRLTDFINKNTFEQGEYFSLLINEWEKENIIVFDVESTGVDVTEDEIIQIAAIKINKEGKVIERFEKFIKPVKSVGKSALVHGFTDEILAEKGENKIKVLNEFIEFSKGAIIVGHNVQYDINILTSELSRHNLGKDKFKGFYDTLDIYRRFYPNMINHKLDTLSAHFNTIHKPSHNAMDDILATAELLIMALNNEIVPKTFERLGYITNHLKSFTGFSKAINDLIEKSEDSRPKDIVAFIVNNFNLKGLYPEDEREERRQRMLSFYSFLEEIDDKEKSARDSLIEVVNMTSLSNGEMEELMIKKAQKPRIPIITVHQSKGLEFDYVFLAGLAESKFPSFMALKSGNITEEARLFYVAITRAKKELYLSYSNSNSKGFNVVGSRFIDLLPKSNVEVIK